MSKRIPFLLMPLLALVVGCQSYDKQCAEYRRAYNAGQAQTSCNIADDHVKDAPDRDKLVWLLEAGSSHRMAGNYTQSQTYFTQADNLYAHYQTQADISVSGETVALLTNPATLPYHGMYLDGIMISVYSALNDLSLQAPDAARINITRSYNRQQEAVTGNAKRIAKERKAVNKDKNSSSLQGILNSSAFQQEMATAQADLPNTQGYADYVNPFAVYLDGFFHHIYATDASDRERARFALARAASFAPNNKTIAQDLALASDQKAPPPTVYLIHENGIAPYRKAVIVNIPIIVSSLSYLGFSYPKLVTPSEKVSPATLSSGQAHAKAEQVCRMDAIVSQEFKNDLPSIMTRAVLSALTKAIAAYTLNRQMNEQDELVGLISQIFTAAYQLGSNVPDTRSWTSLPNTFYIASMPLPTNQRISVSIPGASIKNFDLAPDKTHWLIYVRTTQTATQPSYQLIPLR